ncbi:hypothetical protein ACHHYP_09947 [Achlya hypogyna]|uniref:Secreted protein n=1 Tax=Achlya hypogyna TaxID=1202772 RepID=A0A0A7CNV1_ACHHY|nr:secreted protein [Achlya hypogyna]OQR86795.1 hypothetical protein ACHHYP_09947 [Achlya hypogyna]
MLVKLLALAATAAFVAAECPGGCSTNGVCGPRDMCSCFKNFYGNDCSMRICPFGHAHVDTPKGDLNMDRNTATVGFILGSSQMYPGQTWEWNSPDAGTDEAHFYSECSNEGICDRSTGVCTCFPGFEGSACQRASCNSACNNHGVCKSIAQIAANADRANKITGNPRGRIATVYDLWDAKKGYSCDCDPWFEGPDCSYRSCKVGVDPLYEAAGYPIYETFNIIAAVVPTTTLDLTKSWIQLRVYDYYGESYLTKRIGIQDGNVGAVDGGPILQKAFLDLPNQVFTSISCWQSTDSTNPNVIPYLTNEVGFAVACQYNDNPGAHRLPEIAASSFIDSNGNALTSARAFVSANNRRGEDVDEFATASIHTYVSITGTAVTVTSTAGTTIAANTVIKIKDRVTIATAATTTSITLAWALMNVAIPDSATVYYATGLTATLEATCTVAAWAVGANSFTCTAAATSVVVGSRLMYQSATYYVRAISTDGLTVTVDRYYNGKAADGSATTAAAGTDPLFVITKASPMTGTYQYVSPCAGRGLCDRSSGICQCFKGYTDDNCDTQNILAF